MSTINGNLYAVYNKTREGLVTITGGMGITRVSNSIIADTDLALVSRRMETAQQQTEDTLTIAKVEVKILEIL